MVDETRLTPDQARARFGDLTPGPAKAHAHFREAGGEWRPEFDQTGTGLVLRGYRLHPDLRQVGPPRPQYRPKP